MTAPWGRPYDGRYQTPNGIVTLHRKGQRCRFFNEAGEQVGPEQANVAPAIAYAISQGWVEVAPA